MISNEVLKFLMSSVDALKVTKQAAQACRDTELDALVSLRAQDVVMQKHDSEGPISIERMEQYVELYFDPASGQNGVPVRRLRPDAASRGAVRRMAAIHRLDQWAGRRDNPVQHRSGLAVVTGVDVNDGFAPLAASGLRAAGTAGYR